MARRTITSADAESRERHNLADQSDGQWAAADRNAIYV